MLQYMFPFLFFSQDAICKSLQEYNKHIHQLKADMQVKFHHFNGYRNSSTVTRNFLVMNIFMRITPLDGYSFGPDCIRAVEISA
jgi:hypothetical protein